MCEKSRNFFRTHFFRMSLIVKENKTLNKIMVNVFGFMTQMPRSGDSSDLLQKLRFIHNFIAKNGKLS